VGNIAKQLAIDAVPALVGFGRRNGFPVPELDGVLVAARDAPVLRDAHTAWLQAQEREALRQHAVAVQGKWGALVSKVLTRARLRAEYGSF